jgi:type IV pilus assembly protein PilP
MSKLHKFILMAFLTCFVTVFWGCDLQKTTPSKAKVVRKKIIIPKKATAIARQSTPSAGQDSTAKKPGRSRRPSAVVKKVSAAELRPKSDIAVTPAGRKSSKLVAKNTVEPVKQPTGDLPKQTKRVTKAIVKNTATASAKQTSNADSVDKPLDKKVQPQLAAVKVATPNKPVEKVASSAAVIQPVTAPPPPKVNSESATTPAATVAANPAVKDNIATKRVPQKGEVPAYYNPKGRINPFEPLFKDEPEVVPVMAKKKKRIPRTPLEKIDLGQLKLVGIIMASSGNRALVQEASGKGYIIKEGTFIGLHSGKVTEIKRDRVLIEEEPDEFVGKQKIRNKELVLPKPPGE